ncbi:SAM-dependent methyltransferase, partial [Candidatus Pacearchaeota archaeon]|nr:SAM-dependent methyltransferase [Candidatus Pacearchaeota archaeon]
MPTEIGRIKKYLKGFDFDSLFIEELGWDNHDSTLDVNIDGTIFELSAIAHKRGFVAYLCEISQKDTIPLYQLRRKIENKVVKSIREHVIIFTDSTKTRQIWQWVKREVGKPTACREHHYYSNQTGEAIAQKLHRITFTLEEEETLTTPDVAFRVKAGLDVEKITKRFYDIFKKEHAAFLKFITGIPDKNLHEWYASVMLNRLMFIYFIQKKDFLHEDQNYLANKLGLMKQKGKDIYYKEFLCPLFFEGFAKPSEERKIKFNRLFGSVPYLNGGIFQKHQIEQIHGKTIQVPDKAFERIYEFFNAYQWHLDERPMHEDNEINPDVLGYIFEKYIN